MSNIIDSIKVSGVTYEIQGGSITVDPTLDSGSTNPVANSAITTALDAKVNVADNEVSGLTLAFNIGAKEYYSGIDNITKLRIKSTAAYSGSRTASFYIYHTTGGSQISCSVQYTYQNNWINSINSTSGNITATLNNGVIDITLDSGYYFYYINSINNFAVIGYKNYSGGQSARVIEGSVNQALSDVSTKIPPISVVGVDMYYANNGTINLERQYSSGTSWLNTSIPLNDEKTLKYDTSTGLYVNFKGQTAHTNTLNTSSGNYCYIPSVAASYDYAYDSFTVRVNSAYTGSSTSFTWTISGISEDGGAYANVYVYDKTSNTVTLTSRSFEVDVTQNGYYFTFTANNSQSPSNPIKLSQFREGNCNICGTGNTIPNAYIIDLVQAPTYEYNGQEVIDDIYSKLDTKQTTLTAGTGIDITNNVISATGGGGGGVPESTFTAYTAATDSRIAEDEEVTAAALNALDEKIDNIDGTATVELTQAEYDALVTAGTVSADTYYIITDAQAGDLTNYYTKTEVDNAITSATSTKQDTLVSGTNIKTINNQSLLGSGNIDIQGGGGGKAIEAGRGISITTGETADTVSFDLPISADTKKNITVFDTNNGISGTSYIGKNMLVGNANVLNLSGSSYGNTLNFLFGNINTIAKNSTANSAYNTIFGYYNTLSGATESAFICGYNNIGRKSYQVIGGRNNNSLNTSEAAFGQYNNSVSGSSTFGDSGNTLFSVGNGTADDARHNAFEIRQNGDIYLSSGGTDIKLQDHLGGGGGGTTYTAGRGIDITNDTISFSLPISAGTGTNSIIEGLSTTAMSLADHAEGFSTYAKGNGYPAHAEGYQTSATSYYCHSEGRGTKATNEACHAEGKSTEASGDYSHAEGEGTKAMAQHSHSEGAYTTASSVTNVSGLQMYQGYKSRHTEGCYTIANNGCTHTEGYWTQANNFGEHASGVYNVSNSATTTYGDSGNTLFSVGNGTADNARHNAFEIRQNGDIYITINGQDVKLQDILLQLSGTTS